LTMTMTTMLIYCQVREETETRVDVPTEGADVTVITVSGPKDNVDKAKEMLESTQRALVGLTAVSQCLAVIMMMIVS